MQKKGEKKVNSDIDMCQQSPYGIQRPFVSFNCAINEKASFLDHNHVQSESIKPEIASKQGKERTNSMNAPQEKLQKLLIVFSSLGGNKMTADTHTQRKRETVRE